MRSRPEIILLVLPFWMGLVHGLAVTPKAGAAVSPLKALALSQANAAAATIVETNQLLGPDCPDGKCAPLAAAKAKKTLLPPASRKQLARVKLWGARKLLDIADCLPYPPAMPYLPLMRFRLTRLLLKLFLVYIALPTAGLLPLIELKAGGALLRYFLIFLDVELVWA